MKKVFLILLSCLCIIGINSVKAKEADAFEETSSIEIIDNTTYNIIDRIYKKGTSEEYRILKIISDKDSSYYVSRNDYEYIDDVAWKTSNFGPDGVTPF